MIAKKNIVETIQKGIDFLYRSQLPWGEFKTLASFDPLFIFSHFDSSPFFTSLILYSIKDIPDERVKIITKKGIDFLISEMEDEGVWRFWTKREKNYLPPDLDDIANISLVLKLNGIKVQNRELIVKNKNEKNLFLTWVEEERVKKSFWWKKIKGQVDCVVNANVLAYLGEEIKEVLDFLKDMVRKKEFFSYYYPSKLSFFYFLSRAFKEGIESLREVKEEVIRETIKFQKKNGSFGNELETALALNTFFNFDYFGEEIESGIRFLLKKQKKEGSFRCCYFFYGAPFYLLAIPPGHSYYGSSEFTTSLCLEAFQKYVKLR
jgi:hypothetical protein